MHGRGPRSPRRLLRPDLLLLHLHDETVLASRALRLLPVAIDRGPRVAVGQEQVSPTVAHHVCHFDLCRLDDGALDVPSRGPIGLRVTALEPARHELALDRVLLFGLLRGFRRCLAETATGWFALLLRGHGSGWLGATAWLLGLRHLRGALHVAIVFLGLVL